MRKTVTIVTADCPEPREFHLEETKAERFAAKVRAEGGIAMIGPFKMSDALCSMLRDVGVE
jgi:hypothetical protein